MKLRNAGLLAVVITAAVACKPAGAPVTQGALFWQLEKDGTTSYLLGTMHLGVDPHTLPDLVWQKLDEKPTFAMETDLSDASKLAVQRTDGKTLRDELGPAYWAKLEDALGAGPARSLMKMKPMIPATLLAMRGLPHTAPMDGALHARASTQQKKIVFLEELEVEAAVLERWMNKRALEDMLDDLAGTEQRSKRMLDAYVAGDGDQLMAVFAEEKRQWLAKGRSEREWDEQMADLLYKRNASWIEPIEKLHAGGGGFIAIGAAHALGPNSVLELLEHKGFKITRLTP